MIPYGGKLMNLTLTDTSPEAAKIQIQLLQQASPSQRAVPMCALSRTTMLMAWRAISRANPKLSDVDIDLFFVEYLHGRELAAKLKVHLVKLGRLQHD